jgi:hypothetical protein
MHPFRVFASIYIILIRFLVSCLRNSKQTDINHLEHIPFVKAGIVDPVANFTDAYYVTKGGEKRVSQNTQDDESTELVPTAIRTNSMYGSLASGVTSLRRSSFLEKSIEYTFGRFSDGSSFRLFHFLVEEEKPSDHHHFYDIEINNVSTYL